MNRNLFLLLMGIAIVCVVSGNKNPGVVHTIIASILFNNCLPSMSLVHLVREIEA
jgi:hypothetical protein